MKLAEFIAMSGYGEFVWSAYGFTLAVLAINFAAAVRSLKKSKSRKPPVD